MNEIFSNKFWEGMPIEMKNVFDKGEKEKRMKDGFIKLGVKFSKEISQPKKGWVYFIQDSHTGYIKIGWADDPYRRLKNLQTGCAGKLILLGAFEGTVQDEHQHHKLMNNNHVRGEWFNDYDNNIELYAKEKNTYKL